jgi:hypothetical protein
LLTRQITSVLASGRRWVPCILYEEPSTFVGGFHAAHEVIAFADMGRPGGLVGEIVGVEGDADGDRFEEGSSVDEPGQELGKELSTRIDDPGSTECAENEG